MIESDFPTWEWRSFAPELEPPQVAWPPPFDMVDETYIICPESDARAIIRGHEITVDVREQCRGGLELWRRSFSARFPLCQRDVREVLRQFPVAPPTLYRPEYDAYQFATEVAGCTNGLRVVGGRLVRRTLPIEGCELERTVISVAGETMQTLAVTGRDADSVNGLVRRLQLTRFETRSTVDAVKNLLGVHPHAHA